MCKYIYCCSNFLRFLPQFIQLVKRYHFTILVLSCFVSRAWRTNFYNDLARHADEFFAPLLAAIKYSRTRF